jgi:BlaR1 peptidase M56
MLQTTVFWAACLAFYALFLRYETYFQLNRVYLLGTFCFGLCLPLLTAPIVSNIVPPQEMVVYIKPALLGAKATGTQIATAAWSYPRILWLLYSIGAGLASVRFAIGIVQILRLVWTGEKQIYEGYTIIYDEKVRAPFSFLKYVFLTTDFKNENQSNEQQNIENQLIIQHEIAHIKQKHSFDVLLLALVGIFFWWNPCLYFYRYALRNTHEYLADEAATASTSRKNYGKLLIEYALRLQTKAAFSTAISNSFFHSQLQQRIFMLTKPQSANLALSKYALLFPLFCGIFFAFNTAVFGQTQNQTKNLTPTHFVDMEQFLKVKTIKNLNTLLGLLQTAEIQSFEMTRVKPDGDPVTYANLTGEMERPTEKLIAETTLNDKIYFDKVIIKEDGNMRTVAAVFKVVKMEGVSQKVDAQKMINAHQNKDICAILGLPETVEIQRFELTYHKPDHDPMTTTSPYADGVRHLLVKAKAGDTYYFDQVVIKDGETMRYFSAVCKIVE